VGIGSEALATGVEHGGHGVNDQLGPGEVGRIGGEMHRRPVREDEEVVRQYGVGRGVVQIVEFCLRIEVDGVVSHSTKVVGRLTLQFERHVRRGLEDSGPPCRISPPSRAVWAPRGPSYDDVVFTDESTAVTKDFTPAQFTDRRRRHEVAAGRRTTSIITVRVRRDTSNAVFIASDSLSGQFTASEVGSSNFHLSTVVRRVNGFVAPRLPWRRQGGVAKSKESVIATVPGDHRVNERIRVETIRLIDNEGNQRGVTTTREALALARSLDLDLVEIAPTAQPPVCRIMDYGKFKFDEAQKAKESRRKTQNVGVKEMKYRPKIGPGDFDTKTRLVEKFLNEGHKVKVTIMFRGRESAHPELGKKILDRIVEKLVDVAKVESAAKLDGRNMIMVLGPEKKAKPKVDAEKLDVERLDEVELVAVEREVPATVEASAPAQQSKEES
jgi:translation initiation factor IF-3